MEAVGYLSLFFVGLWLGALGGGGSLLSVPIFVYLFSIDAVQASGYSLFVVGSSSLLGAFFKYKEEKLSLRVALLFGMPSIISIFCSRKWLLPLVPEVVYSSATFELRRHSLLLLAFALLMILGSAMMIHKGGVQSSKREGMRRRPIHLVFLGMLTGAISGFIGIGGGFIIIPVLVTFSSLPLAAAIGTSLLIIAGNSIVGFASGLFHYPINWVFLTKISAFSFAGMFLGVRFTRRLAARQLADYFAWVLLLVGCFIMARELYTVWLFGSRLSTFFNPAGF